MDDVSFTCNGDPLDFSNKSEKELDRYIKNNFDNFIYSVVFPITLICGCLLNFSFIYVVWKIRDMRNHLNLILINLSIADVAFLLSSCSWKTFGTLSSPLDINFDQNLLGRTGCRWIIFLNDFFSFASLFFVTFIAVERYYAVCMPLRHLRMVGKKRSFVSCSIVWALSMLFAAVLLPAHWNYTIKCITWPSDTRFEDFPSAVGSCASTSDTFDQASFALLTIPFFLALFLNLFIYIRIIATLQRRVVNNDVNSETDQASELSRKQQRARNAAARMLVINGLVFFCCNSPFNVLATLMFVLMSFGVTPKFAGLSIAMSICRLLFYINSAINPLIYGAANSRYRRSFYVTLRCKRPLTPETLSLSETRHRTSAVTQDYTRMTSPSAV